MPTESPNPGASVAEEGMDPTYCQIRLSGTGIWIKCSQVRLLLPIYSSGCRGSDVDHIMFELELKDHGRNRDIIGKQRIRKETETEIRSEQRIG